MNQDKKKALAPAIKAVLKKFNMKGTIAVRHYSTLVVNIKEGPLFAKLPSDRAYCQLSAGIPSDSFEGEEAKFLEELGDAMNNGNHDRSDFQTDYFDVGWYSSINVGSWNKPFICTKAQAQTTLAA